MPVYSGTAAPHPNRRAPTLGKIAHYPCCTYIHWNFYSHSSQGAYLSLRASLYAWTIRSPDLGAQKEDLSIFNLCTISSSHLAENYLRAWLVSRFSISMTEIIPLKSITLSVPPPITSTQHYYWYLDLAGIHFRHCVCLAPIITLKSLIPLVRLGCAGPSHHLPFYVPPYTILPRLW